MQGRFVSLDHAGPERVIKEKINVLVAFCFSNLCVCEREGSAIKSYFEHLYK